MSYSTREMDYTIEQIANQFEDKYFWPRQLGSNLSCMNRYIDTIHQFAGVDFSLTMQNRAVNFDTKVKYYNCLNQVLQTPGFEVSFKNAIGNVQDGWLVADGNQADFYELIGLSCTVNQHTQLSAVEQITGIDILWVSKKDLYEYVQQYTSFEDIKADAKTLRECYDRGENNDIIDVLINNNTKPNERKKYPHRKFHLTYSPKLKEQPVNLVMYRDALEALPHTRHFVVTKDYVKNTIREVK